MHVILYTLNIHIIHFLCTRYYPGEQVLEWIRDVKYYFCSVGALKLMGKKEKKDNYRVSSTKTGCTIQPWRKKGFLFQLQSREKDKDQGKVQKGSNT